MLVSPPVAPGVPATHGVLATHGAPGGDVLAVAASRGGGHHRVAGHADAGVDYPVENVLQKVRADKKDGEEQGCSHDHRVVGVEDRTHELLADAWYGEDGLDDKRPRHQRRDRKSVV